MNTRDCNRAYNIATTGERGNKRQQQAAIFGEYKTQRLSNDAYRGWTVQDVQKTQSILIRVGDSMRPGKTAFFNQIWAIIIICTFSSN